MLFASPWFLGFSVLVGGPILFSIIISLTSYDVLSPARFVGAENYRDVVRDPLFLTSIANTAFMLLRVPLMMALSLAIAILLNRGIRGIGLYRAAFYLPAIMPLVASSLLWMWIFNPSSGGINEALRWLFNSPPLEWLEAAIGSLRGRPFQFALPLWIYDPAWSKPSLVLMSLWAAGGGMIIWLAGLQSIPAQLYEAASIDGASAWGRFVHITIPMLSPYILFNAIIGVIHTLQMFDQAYVMTGGGPADSTLFYSLNLFWQGFRYFRMGYASAMAWILFLIVLSLTLLQLWLSRKWVHYERS
jgi:multiple sugar transport system permease protein